MVIEPPEKFQIISKFGVVLDNLFWEMKLGIEIYLSVLSSQQIGVGAPV